MQMLIGAAIFAVGVFFGAMIFSAGQQSQKNRTSQRLQDALLKSFEKSGRDNGVNL